ncbi:hypothetical protein C8R46DRAFT_1106294, partial [Mycena filopes]
ETVYKLDLDDIIAFPDTAHVPFLPPNPGESWIIFGEIVRDDSIMRPVYRVRDKIDCEFPVAFYTDNPAAGRKLPANSGIFCASRAVCATNFSTDRTGYRIEDPSTVFVLPCSMAELRGMNQRLRKKNDAGEMELCRTLCYCSKDCQAADWRQGGHRKECPVMHRLSIWNRTDWG